MKESLYNFIRNHLSTMKAFVFNKVVSLSALAFATFLACGSNTQQQKDENVATAVVSQQNSKELNIQTRGSVKNIEAPNGFKRSEHLSNSFAYYLANIKLKSDKTVYLYDGREKPNQNAQFAVLDISVPNQDLQQCADAVMRLRAEYLFAQQRYSDILFIDNEGGKYQFTAPYTKARFDKYLLRVFGMCGTASLTKQLKLKPNLNSIEAGDVFIKGGFPGHAVIVMDVVKNSEGEKQFLLAQSYMPAQDIHILKNPANSDDNPWYKVSDIGSILETPEYRFTKDQLKTW